VTRRMWLAPGFGFVQEKWINAPGTVFERELSCRRLVRFQLN
jgi:hypothetical protein